MANPDAWRHGRLYQVPHVSPMDTQTLIQQLETLWQTETGMESPVREIAQWLAAAKHPVATFDAIKKTGRKVRSVAQTDRPMVLEQAVAYCRNVIRSANDRRSRTV